MSVIFIDYENFKKLSKGRRVYYYIGETVCDLHFISDGMIVKTNTVIGENRKQFFSDEMFYGGMQLKFNIPTPKVSALEEYENNLIPSRVHDLYNIQDEEVKNTDIQREGAE